jgi:poly-gamma-glutamate capsule biosynthesis protein CapA/YwtB (metallophosphatase superfamily)
MQRSRQLLALIVAAVLSVGLAASVDATPASPARSFTIVATGDMLLHERLWNQARQDATHTGAPEMDFVPLIAAVQPYVSNADLGLCHLETPLAPLAGPYEGYPLFSAPPQIATALATVGYDACSTASNHTFDKGAAGVQRTLDTLDSVGIAHAGSARTPEEALTTTVLDVAGVKVALLSYTYGFNGIPYPNGESWRADVIDAPRILTDARTAKQAGAEVVVVSMHWGTEYEQTPNAQQLELAPPLAQSKDIDLVIGHHAHVVQPVEKIDDTWVAYGLGNLVAAHRTPGEARSEGLLVRFRFAEQPDGRFVTSSAEYLPLLITDAFPVRVLAVAAALSTGQHGTSSAARLQEALDRTTSVVESRGGPAGGLVRIG